MEMNRCTAIGVNGRHCAKTINSAYGDLCTTHGKMVQRGDQLARYQPPVTPEARAQMEQYVHEMDQRMNDLTEREQAARVVQDAARRHLAVDANHVRGVPTGQLVNRGQQIGNDPYRGRGAPAPGLNAARMQELMRNAPPGSRVNSVFEGAARVIGPVPRPGEQIVAMTEAQFRALTFDRAPIRNESESEASAATMAKLLAKVNTTPFVCQDRLGTPCPICCEELKEDAKDFGLPCGHDMHVECGAQLQNDQCPMCRKEFTRLREDTEVNKAIIYAIKARKENVKQAQRRDEMRATEDVIRNMMMPRREESSSDEEDNEPPGLEEQDDNGHHRGLRDQLPVDGSPEWDTLIARVIDEYTRDDEYQEDPEYFHAHLHHTLNYSCEDLYILQARVAQILS